MKSSLGIPLPAAARRGAPDPLRYAARPRTLWRLRRAKSSRERAERGRGRPKRRGRARATMWRRRDDRSAVSVTATVARRGSAAGLRSPTSLGILDLSLFLFFSLLFLSLSISSRSRPVAVYRIRRKVGRRRWRRFLGAHARA